MFRSHGLIVAWRRWSMIRTEADGVIANVVRNGIWLGAGEAAVKGGLLAVAVLIARGTGPAGVGTFSIAFGAAMVGIMILAFGQQEVLIREVAKTPENARSALAASHGLQRRLARWLLPAGAAAALVVPDVGLRLTLLSFLPYVAFRTAMVTKGAAFKGLDRMDVEVRARGLELLVAVAGVGAGVVLRWPLWTTGVAFSLGAGLGLVWITRTARVLEPVPPAGPGFAVFREGFPFMMLAVLGQLLVNTDRFLLAFLGVSRGEIGYWGVAATVVWAVAAAPQLMAVAVYPTFSRLAHRGRTWRRAGFASAAAGFTVGLVCAFVLRQVSGPVVDLFFGPDFEPTVELMRRLALVLPGAFTMTIVGTVFAAWQRQNASMWILAAAFCISVTFNLVWIPRSGAMACANAAVAAFSAGALVMATALLIPAKPKAGVRG